MVVLGNTSRDVDPIGKRLLGAAQGGPFRGEPPATVAVTIAILLAAVLPLLLFTRRPTPGTRWRATDRLAALSTAATTAMALMLAYRFGAWLTLPTALWPATVALAIAGGTLVLFRWRELPPTQRPTSLAPLGHHNDLSNHIRPDRRARRRARLSQAE